LGRVQAQSYFYDTSIQHGKATLHDDGTRTESVKDMNKREITETTYDSRGIVISKKLFMVNENGDPIRGIIYDGQGNHIAKVDFGFDDLGRLRVERCTNMQGEVFRQVIHTYDPSGKRLRPQAFDYAVKAPNMKPATIDFTGRKPAPDRSVDTAGAASETQQPQVVQPGQQPQVMSVSPSGYVQPTQQAQPNQEAFQEAYQRQMQPTQSQAVEPKKEEKKRGFWPFGKKDK